MTSANVIEYNITDKKGGIVGHHRQNVMCKSDWSPLLNYIPANKYLIQAWGYDEEEDIWEDEPENLETFLKRLKVLK